MSVIGAIEPILKPNPVLGERWMFFVFLLIFSLLAVLRWSYAKNFKELFQAVINIRLLREILREEIILTSRASQLLIVSAFLSIGLYVKLVFNYLDFKLLGFQLTGFLEYVWIIAFMLSIYSVKLLVIFVIRRLFLADNELLEYEFNVSLMLKLAGVGLIPVSLLLAYFSTSFQLIWIVLGALILTGSLMWRWLRGVAHAVSNRISILYIILYLCTLEFLPVAVLLKVLI
ncbi:MAG: DUF4271 domain-containing protein [Flavobacteriales bacterium]